jgi:integrase
MRIRESYSLYKRYLPSGQVVFYYRTYDSNGGRLCGHSTGQTTKTAAREYCNKLNREGKLIPEKIKRINIPTFGEFAVDFWDFEKSEYLKNQMGRRLITRSYANQGAYNLEAHLLPVFGNKKLNAITMDEINTWLIHFCDNTYLANDGKTALHYKHNTANLAFKFLKIMLEYAVFTKYLKANPCKNVKMLHTLDERKIDILTPDEAKKLFNENWADIWVNRVNYVLNKLAAATGMRHGELLGLRGEFVYDTYIDVCAQYNRYGYGDVKSHKPRNIPINQALRTDLETLIKINGNGYIFSRNGGKNPISRNTVSKELYNALKKIGIDEKQRKERCLCMHGWRHFLISALKMANISDAKAMEIAGHASTKISRHYTHLDTIRMADVVDVQSKLFLPEPGKEPVPVITQIQENPLPVSLIEQAPEKHLPSPKVESALERSEPVQPSEKRPKGRPRKAEPAEPVQPVGKKTRGRPRKMSPAQQVDKRPRGRPRKIEPVQVIEKRLKGRPQKAVIS